jgi:hypothetical protein
MKVTPFNAADVTAALVEQVAHFPAVDDLGVRVESNEPINTDGGRCPWVGVYETRQQFSVRTLGLGPGFRRQRLELAVVMTEQSMNSGRECEERLERLITAVCGAILSDPSIRATVETTADEFAVTYSNFKDEGGAFFKQAVLQFAVEQPVNVEY